MGTKRVWHTVLPTAALAGALASGALAADDKASGLLAECQRGQGDKCDALTEVAAHMQVGQAGTPAQPAAALKIYLDLCELDRKTGCTLAAHLLRQGATDVARQPGRAMKLYRKACSLGEGGACMTVGSLLAAEPQGERVRGESLVYLEEGCRLKYAQSCEDVDKMRRVLGEAKYKEVLAQAQDALKVQAKP
jgi:uncharacterized protein